MGVDLDIPPELESLLTTLSIPDLQASLFNYTLEYMMALEGLTKDGAERKPHSPQAPQGMVRKNLAVIESVLVDALKEAIEKIANGADPKAAISEALTSAINFALTTVVLDTPIDTGRARLTWAITFPGGETKGAGALGIASPAKPPEQSKWKDREFVNAHLRAKRAAAREAGTSTESKRIKGKPRGEPK